MVRDEDGSWVHSGHTLVAKQKRAASLAASSSRRVHCGPGDAKGAAHDFAGLDQLATTTGSKNSTSLQSDVSMASVFDALMATGNSSLEGSYSKGGGAIAPDALESSY